MAAIVTVAVLGGGVALADTTELFDDWADGAPSDGAPSAGSTADPAGATGAPTTSPTPTAQTTGDDAEAVSDTRGRALEKLAQQAEKLARLKEQQAEVPTAVFRVSTLNVLGDSHTTKGGDKPGYASGPARMGGTVGLLVSQGVDVVALQEFEQVQKGAFQRIAGGSWGLHSADAKARDSVAWRTETWELVEAGSRYIPYFHGNPAPMPWVLLRHRATEREVYFISLHNPTSNPRRGNNEGSRDAATGIQINLVAELRETGRPVVLMGDFNERDEAFCRVTAQGGMIAANGGSGGPPCLLPPQTGIDWIFGTTNLEFSNYLHLDGPATNRLTDHPLIVATATYSEPVPESEEPDESEN